MPRVNRTGLVGGLISKGDEPLLYLVKIRPRLTVATLPSLKRDRRVVKGRE
jgi:hypothetical protein